MRNLPAGRADTTGTMDYSDFLTSKAPAIADVFIYGLVDPRDRVIRYVGKSVRPMERLANHMNEKSRTWRTNWLRGLRAAGLRPTLIVLEVVHGGAKWQLRERAWIAAGRLRGWPLTNCTNGGDGVPGLPPEVRERMRAVWTGRKHRPESLLKMAASRKGRKHTQSHREMMRERMTGRTVTWGRKLAASLRKLREDDIHEIRYRLEAGETQLSLAAAFGVDKGTISNIKRGVSYGDIPWGIEPYAKRWHAERDAVGATVAP